MKNFALKKPLTKNQLDDLTNGLVNAMRYSDSNVEYPEFDKVKRDDGVIAEWFYPIFKGSNDFSEFSAIYLYVTQESAFEDLGELMLGIALVEMKHFDKLSDFIKKIGGRIDQKYDSASVVIGKTPEEAIQKAIDGERKTIDFYESLMNKLAKLPETETIEITLQFLAKLVADEKVHLDLLQERRDEI